MTRVFSVPWWTQNMIFYGTAVSFAFMVEMNFVCKLIFFYLFLTKLPDKVTKGTSIQNCWTGFFVASTWKHKDQSNFSAENCHQFQCNRVSKGTRWFECISLAFRKEGNSWNNQKPVCEEFRHPTSAWLSWYVFVFALGWIIFLTNFSKFNGKS